MPNKLMWTFIGVDLLFLAGGCLIIAFAVMSEAEMRATPQLDTVATHVLLEQCPLTAGIVNAIFVFLTFLVSLPALALPQNRGWLRAHGWLVVICAIFTLALGINIWFDTLETRSNIERLWGQESRLSQSLLQQKFDCCGYINSTSPPFIMDNTCSSTLVAAQKQGCVGPFSNFANSYLDLIFTMAFGIVGIDVIMLLCTVMVIKYRGELIRYRHIDEKNGNGGI
ncbi:hypothetical protein BDY21DRAFT_98937 [Lineolata rhizophorae]|uniref:Tetraspanin n=1 Tax=Lineolata rhizophorae TaxID=578093 RepID=A0A6A6NTI7_9PEZI|nr:hypothetical protein BDY21DRAFT_98937 [Lineolata rhizophorae]